MGNRMLLSKQTFGEYINHIWEGNHLVEPKELAQKYVCIPLERIGNLLTVVMADPTNERAVKEIEVETKCRIQVFVATTTEIANAIQQYYGISIAAASKPDQNVSQISFKSAADRKRDENKAVPQISPAILWAIFLASLLHLPLWEGLVLW